MVSPQMNRKNPHSIMAIGQEFSDSVDGQGSPPTPLPHGLTPIPTSSSGISVEGPSTSDFRESVTRNYHVLLGRRGGCVLG